MKVVYNIHWITDRQGAPFNYTVRTLHQDINKAFENLQDMGDRIKKADVVVKEEIIE